MKKTILIAFLLIFSILGIQQIESPNAFSVHAAQNLSGADAFEVNVLEASKYVNQAAAEMQQGKFAQAYTTFDKAFKYFDLAEKKLVATPNYKDRDNLLYKIRRSKATIYALKGKLEIEYYMQIAKGVVNLKKALELHPEKSAETLLVYANVALQHGHSNIAEIYIDQVLAANNVPANYVEMAKSLKARI